MTTAEMIDDYREIRTAHAVAWERADRAFRRWMNGETRSGSAAKRLSNAAETISLHLHDARMRLDAVGIDASAIDDADRTDTAIHYRLASS